MRYLLPFLLVVLCLSALSGAALAADGWATGTNVTIPGFAQWENSAAASIDVDNTGDTTWDDTFGLLPETDRWGVSEVPGGDVLPTESETFSFNIVAPPVSSVKYNVPVSPTTAPVMTTFADNWVLGNAGVPITTDLAEGATQVNRFSDVGPAETNGMKKNFAGQIEEMAGFVPFITSGYSDGTYRGDLTVNRGQMAAFIARAMKLDLPTVYPTSGFFSDVPESLAFWPYIKALSDESLVNGYGDGTFLPGNSVNRGAMAGFLAKAVTGNSIPDYTGTPDFSDVADTYGWYDAIEYGKHNDMLSGYGDGRYLPLSNVSRGAMASFLFRTFIKPTDAVVVVGGPAITLVDPSSTSYVGWNNAPVTLDASAPGYAYIVLDKVRLGPALAGTDDSFDVTFTVLDSTDAVVGTPTVVSFTGAELTALHDEGMASADGLVYKLISVAMPTGLAEGAYTLVVSTSDELERTWDINRTVAFSVGTSAWLVAKWGRDKAEASLFEDITHLRSLVAGTSEASMADKDGTGFETKRGAFPTDDWADSGCAGDGIVWHGIPANASSIQIKVTYSIDNTYFGVENNCCDQWGGPGDDGVGEHGFEANCCGSWGTLDPPWPGHTPAYTYTLETAPYGWGMRVMTAGPGLDNWQTPWWENEGTDTTVPPDGDDDVWALDPDASGDPNVPALNDFQGGGPMFDHIGFTGHPWVATDFQWGTTNAADAVDYSGDVLVFFCGGSYDVLNVDQAVLQYTMGPL